jgi:hypothetical protein
MDKLEKSAVSPKAAMAPPNQTLGTASSLGGSGAVVRFSVSGPICLKYTDPDGKTPAAVVAGRMLIGGTTSAAVDYGAQVLGNVVGEINSGKMLGEVDFRKALTDINIGKVGAAFVSGAINGAAMPGVGAVAGNVGDVKRQVAQRVVQAAGGAIVNAVASVPATIAENKINNKLNGTNTPLTRGMAENAIVSAGSGFIAGMFTKPTNIPSSAPNWYSEKQVVNQSMIRQGASELLNAVRDKIVSSSMGSLYENN